MAKQFLRVTENWTELFSPREDDAFMLNVSGVTVQVHLTDSSWNLSGDPKVFAIGGPISQLRAEKNQYVYARACSDIAGNEAIVVVDSSRINNAQQDDVQAELNNLSVQVMHLTERMTEEELKSVYNSLNYELFLRQFLNSNLRTQENLMTLQNQILQLNFRLYAAEQFIQQHRKEYNQLLFQIKDIASSDGLTSQINKLAVEVNQVMSMANNINTKLNELIPRVDEAWGDFEDLLSTYVTPIETTLESLHVDFVALNNAMVKLGAQNSPEQIEETFKEILKDLSPDMVAPITALKNVLIDLSLAMQKNDEQDQALETRIDKSDTLIMASDSSILSNLEVTSDEP